MILYAPRQVLPSVLSRYRFYAILRPILGGLALVAAFALPLSVFAVLAVLWVLVAVQHVRYQTFLFYELFEQFQGKGE